MIQQRYGNNIPLRITLATALTGRSVEVSVLRQQGRIVPFSFTTEGSTITGTIFGKDQPNRPDVLSLRITLDRGTERQQVLDIPNIVRLVADSRQSTLTSTQMIAIITNSITTTTMAVEQPRPRIASVPAVSPAGKAPTHEPMAEGAHPDVVLS